VVEEPASARSSRCASPCHQGPVSTQCASTARTFHSRPRHRNCSGPSLPSPRIPGPRTQPLRTSTGSSYFRIDRLLTPRPVPGAGGGGVEVAPTGMFEHLFEHALTVHPPGDRRSMVPGQALRALLGHRRERGHASTEAASSRT
jgi:hypothetical protein